MISCSPQLLLYMAGHSMVKREFVLRFGIDLLEWLTRSGTDSTFGQNTCRTVKFSMIDSSSRNKTVNTQKKQPPTPPSTRLWWWGRPLQLR